MHSQANSAKKRKSTNGENKLNQKRLKINRPICGTSACNACGAGIYDYQLHYMQTLGNIRIIEYMICILKDFQILLKPVV